MHKNDPLAIAIRAADPNANLSVALYDQAWTNPRVFRLDAWVLNGDDLDTRWVDVSRELAELHELAAVVEDHCNRKGQQCE